MASPDYSDALDPKYKEPHPVPIVDASEETLKDYGRLVWDFDSEEVWIETWPQPGWRPVQKGTGNEGGIVSGNFDYWWEGEYLKAQNHAVGRKYITGRLPADVKPSKRTYVLVRDINYHRDGGQVFYPRDNTPFVMLLALPGDNVKLEDFVAFYCDGSFGVQIKPNIWHQGVYPIADQAVYLGKQGKVHACIVSDTADEFGRYLSIPLTPP